MKKTATIVISDRKANEYFCLLSPVQAKKVLFAMNLLKGDQRLGDSNIAEVRHIASFYDGVINANYAKELADMLAAEYSKMHPGMLLTKKKAEGYTHADYRALQTAVGHYGFDYVITALALGKTYVMNPENGIEEKHMLNALRWDERRPDKDPETSNDRHRRKGLQLVGLGDMVEELLPHTFIVARVYELVTPSTMTVSFDEGEDNEPDGGDTKVNKADMVAAFIDNAHLLKDFYGTSKPTIPEGFPEEELCEGSYTYSLAEKGMFKDCEAVLKYVEGVKQYESCQKRISEVFTQAEIQVITEKADTVKAILRLVQEL